MRDKLGFPAHDIGHGWLIFDLPEADMGVHPAGTPEEPSQPAKGVAVNGPVENQGWGLVTSFDMPGGVTAMLYQPMYKKG